MRPEPRDIEIEEKRYTIPALPLAVVRKIEEFYLRQDMTVIAKGIETIRLGLSVRYPEVAADLDNMYIAYMDIDDVSKVILEQAGFFRQSSPVGEERPLATSGT